MNAGKCQLLTINHIVIVYIIPASINLPWDLPGEREVQVPLLDQVAAS